MMLIESWIYMEVNTLNKTLSVIYADTYDDSWGSTIEVFGIADNEEDIEKICYKNFYRVIKEIIK